MYFTVMSTTRLQFTKSGGSNPLPHPARDSAGSIAPLYPAPARNIVPSPTLLSELSQSKT